MDLISQIVATKGNIDVAEVENDLDELSLSTERLKRKMKSELDNYDNLLLRSILIKATSFKQDTTSLMGSVIELEKRIKELMSKDGFIEESRATAMLESIQIVANTLMYLQNVEEVESYLKSVEDVMKTDYLNAAVKLIKSKSLINKYIKKGDFANFFKFAVESYCELSASLKVDMTKKWNELIVFKHVKRDKKILSSSLTVDTGSGNLKLNHIFQSLQILQVPYKEDFYDHFFSEILHPVLNHTCFIQIQQSGVKWTITIDYTKESPKMSFENVVSSLIKIFQVINAHLDLKSDTDYLNFIPSIGLLCSNEFVNLFIEKHLSKELNMDNGYDHLVHLTKELMDVTLEKGFLIKDNKLNDYISNIQANYETRIFSHYKETAEKLMKKEFLDLLHVKSVVLSNPMSDMTLAPTVHTDLGRTETAVFHLDFCNTPQKNYLFPECQISKSVEELVNLLDEILNKALDSGSLLKVGLCKTITEIIDMYASVTRHQPLTPQHSALAFNNSMFLIMNLIHLDKDYQTGYSFCGLVYKLQNLALEVLNQQMVSQQSKLSDSIHKLGLGYISEMKDSPDVDDSIMRESLCQLIHLRDAWINILPADVYCTSMGHLCSGFIEDTLSMVLVSQNHHEVDLSNQYHHLFSSLSSEVSQIFKEKNHVEKYVRAWGKLCEICKVLGGTLITVKDRWNKGRGPLSTHFTNLQIRNLITAIFPPSELRQQTLASIL